MNIFFLLKFFFLILAVHYTRKRFGKNNIEWESTAIFDKMPTPIKTALENRNVHEDVVSDSK
jgi:hypothetical protein